MHVLALYHRRICSGVPCTRRKTVQKQADVPGSIHYASRAHQPCALAARAAAQAKLPVGPASMIVGPFHVSREGRQADSRPRIRVTYALSPMIVAGGHSVARHGVCACDRAPRRRTPAARKCGRAPSLRCFARATGEACRIRHPGCISARPCRGNARVCMSEAAVCVSRTITLRTPR